MTKEENIAITVIAIVTLFVIVFGDGSNGKGKR